MNAVDFGDFVLPSVLLGGALLLRGTVAPASRWTQYVRASYMTGSPSTTWLPFSYKRLVAMLLPFAFAVTFLVFIPIVGARVSAAAAWLMLFGLAGTLILSVVAFIFPRPFVPQWIEDVDAGRDIEVDPAMILKVQRANRPLSEGTFRLANAACFVLVLVALSVQADGSVFFGIFLGWAMLLGGQHAR